jgi:hypothetical protein
MKMMKTKITCLILSVCTSFTLSSQIVLQEDFTEPFTPASAGWVTVSRSAPTGTGTVGWTQGNQTGGNGSSTAFNGLINDFYCADFMSLPDNSSGTISEWLITPTLTIYNGAVLQFATRTLAQAASVLAPDRLQVLMNTDASTVIPTGTNSVGSFTNLVFELNPSLGSSTSSVVVGNTVNGYPQAWTVYGIQISGVTGTVTGRFAFRYFVTNGGMNGANSRFVGLDAVRYGLPCAPSVRSYTTCANAQVTLTPFNGLPATNYTWASSANTTTYNTSSITVTAPASGTDVYTMTVFNGTTACGVTETASITVANNLSMEITATGNGSTVCSGGSVRLTVNSPATSLLWGTGTSTLGTSAVITVTPGANTTYTVGGVSGTAPNLCTGMASITLSVIPSPTLSGIFNPSVVCSGASGITLTPGGASTYTYYFSNDLTRQTGSTFQLNAASIPTASANHTILIIGEGANGCQVAANATFAVRPRPTLSVVPSGSVFCSMTQATVTASGALTYTWTGEGVSTPTANPLTYLSSSTSPSQGATITHTLSVTGTNSLGCISDPVVITRTVTLCTGLETWDADHQEAGVFPNPFSNQLRVSGLIGTVELYNALGQLSLRTPVNETAGLDVSDLEKGAYILKMYNTRGEVVRTTKLIKH